MSKVLEQATEVVNKKMAKFIKDYERDETFGSTPFTVRHVSGHYEGYGFQYAAICPNKNCSYYKYTGYPFSPVCNHPKVIWKVEIGGVYACPSISQRLYDKFKKFKCGRR